MSETQPDSHRRIHERAYFLWLGEGCPEGRADKHWQQACEEADSFPASDPSSHTGIIGERLA